MLLLKKTFRSNRTLKKFLLISLIINFTLMLFGGVFIVRRGGIGYLTQQAQSIFGLNTSQSAGTRTPEYARRLSVHEILPIDKSSTVFLGDSIIAGVEWSELMDDDTYLNRGIPGDDSAGVIDRLMDILNSSPDKIVMMVGVNDLHRTGDSDKLLENYKMIIETVEENSPNTELYINSILPYNVNKYDLASTTKMSNDLINDTNDKLRKIAEESDVNYIDLHSLLVDEKGELQDDFTFDGLHLNGEAYIIWGEELQKFLK